MSMILAHIVSVDPQQRYIGDIAKHLNISQRTIRYYEERGLIRPARTNGGFRVYPQSEVERLEAILVLKELGMSLDEIVSLIDVWHEGSPAQVTPKLRSRLVDKLAHLKKTIERYQRGVEQLEAFLDYLRICATCGKDMNESTCLSCLSDRGDNVPRLMKTLV
jgi:DNA-binding transcriptional MerR regulator